MFKVLINTVPFGNINRLPLDLLEKENIEYVVNPYNKKLTEDQLAELVTDFDLLIAGTEMITEKVMSKASNLKHISRVGIGLDNVDLNVAKRRGIKVSYTPDAPAPAVSELTIGMMLTLLRSVNVSNIQMHQRNWYRYLGRRLSKVTIGIIGVGRIGTGVLRHLKGFGEPKILVNDIKEKNSITEEFNVEWVSKERIYQEADIISLHLPLTKLTYNMIQKTQIYSMKDDAILINTSRGGIINEYDLYHSLKSGHLSGAAIDVFEQEPYTGSLTKIERCLLTAHMGSMSVDCRTSMEIEATKETIRFTKGEALQGEVPVEEYNIQDI